MVVQRRYRTAGEPAIASYDHTDLDEGVGYVNYYGCDGTDEYLLTKQSLYSNEVVTSAACSAQTTAALINDIDFDVTFNTHKELKGLLLCSISHGVTTASAAAKWTESYIIVKVRKWDGGETEIANNQSDTLRVVSTGAQTIDSETLLIEVEIPRTHFKSGEAMRITVEQWGKNSDATSSGVIGFGHDPKDRNDPAAANLKVIEDDIPTVMEVRAPFELF